MKLIPFSSLLLLLCFFSCQQKATEADMHSLYLYDSVQIDSIDFDFDQVTDLVAFFDSVRYYKDIPIWHKYYEDTDSGIVNVLFKSISDIDDYRNGRTAEYPIDLIQESLNSLVFEISYCEGHGVLLSPEAYQINQDDNDEVDNADDDSDSDDDYEFDDLRAFFTWYLKLVAYYCPDLSYLADKLTDDGMAGIRYFGSYSTYPFDSYLITKKDKGFKVKSLGEYGMYDDIVRLKDDDENVYYFCTSSIPYFIEVYRVSPNNDVTLMNTYSHSH